MQVGTFGTRRDFGQGGISRMKVIHGVLKKHAELPSRKGGGRETAIAASASAIAVLGVGRETGVGHGQPWGQVGANAISQSQSAFRSKIMSLGKKSQFRSNPGLGPAKSLWVNSLQARGAGGPPSEPLRGAAPGKL